MQYGLLKKNAQLFRSMIAQRSPTNFVVLATVMQTTKLADSKGSLNAMCQDHINVIYQWAPAA